MVNIPYTDILSVKSTLEQYQLLKDKSISGFVLKKFCNFNLKSYVKSLQKNYEKEVILSKRDFINFGQFLMCIDNNARENKYCVVQSSDSGTRFCITFLKGDNNQYIVDTMRSNSDFIDVTVNGNLVKDVKDVYSKWATYMHQCMIDTVCSFIEPMIK